jgi:hypothetical protein
VSDEANHGYREVTYIRAPHHGGTNASWNLIPTCNYDGQNNCYHLYGAPNQTSLLMYMASQSSSGHAHLFEQLLANKWKQLQSDFPKVINDAHGTSTARIMAHLYGYDTNESEQLYEIFKGIQFSTFFTFHKSFNQSNKRRSRHHLNVMIRMLIGEHDSFAGEPVLSPSIVLSSVERPPLTKPIKQGNVPLNDTDVNSFHFC